MKKKNKIVSILFLSASLCLISCGGEKKIDVLEEAQHVIDLDQIEKVGVIGISEFFTGAEVVVLEEAELSLLGGIDKVYAKGDTLLVMDSHSANGVFAFDGQGRFLFRVGSIGRGPGEYTSLSDFTVDTKNGLICILNANAGIINQYKFSNGEYVGLVHMDQDDKIRTNYIQYLDEGIYTDTYFYKKPKESYLLRKLDDNSGKETGHWLSQDEYNLGWNEMYYTGESPFVYSNDSLFRFAQLFMDRIVTVSDKGVEPFLRLKSKDWITAEDLDGKADASTRYSSLIGSRKIYEIHDYIEFESNIWLRYFQGNVLNSVLFRKDTGQARITSIIADDLVYVSALTPHPHSCTMRYVDPMNKTAYAILDAHQLLADYKEGILSEKLVGVEKIATLSDNSNPVIIKYRYE
jgi:hypothetical protein